mmetsp:Transcript_20865/g.31116  ORF Transcript_20865/g.31116 Transcript_20865/m.31116 type:complete len:80 (+) Transcript_20865:65-304(+)
MLFAVLLFASSLPIPSRSRMANNNPLCLCLQWSQQRQRQQSVQLDTSRIFVEVFFLTVHQSRDADAPAKVVLTLKTFSR